MVLALPSSSPAPPWKQEAACLVQSAHEGLPACRKGRWQPSGWTQRSGASMSSPSPAPPPTSRCASQRLLLRSCRDICCLS